MAAQFIERRNPGLHGRRATDSDTSLVRRAAGTTARALAGAIGAAAGVAAGLVRRGKLDPRAEELYWLENYSKEPYYDPSYSFADYLPAYRAGWQGRARYPSRKFEEVEHDLQLEFSWNRGESRLLWQQARDAARAAWDRIT